MINQKRGQFYLIATIIIIAMIAGFAVVSNYAKKREVIKLYYSKQELEIESENVLDYGISNNLNENQMQELLENFIRDYVDYAGERKNLYFIFGDNEINVMTYQNSFEEEACIKVDDGNCNSLTAGGEVQTFVSGNEVTIKTEDSEYIFTLKEGENFYFVISKEIEDEKYVVTS